MADDLLPIETVLNPRVASVEADCGMCGHTLTFDDLDDERARIELEDAFVECPKCGTIADASGVRFPWAWEG